jgi:hypothetical protein
MVSATEGRKGRVLVGQGFPRVCVCVCACVRACVRACARARARVGVGVGASVRVLGGGQTGGP